MQLIKTEGKNVSNKSCVLLLKNKMTVSEICLFSVSTDIEQKAAWKECFQVKGVRLPTGYFFGLSATTGDLSDNHDIFSIKMYELDLPDDVSYFVK